MAAHGAVAGGSPRIDRLVYDTIRERSFNLVFGGAATAARTFDLILLAAILASVGVVIADSVPEANARWHTRLRAVELGFTLAFSVEYLFRLWCHPRPARYAFSFFGLVDAVSILPTYVALLVPGWESLAILRVLRVLRVFRLFSLGRFSRASSVIAHALTASRYKIAVVVVGVLLVGLVAGSLQYLIEGPENGFRSIPEGMYWALITLTTVGNAGLVPLTTAGQVVAAAVMVLGYALIAVPVGVITSEVMASRLAREEILAGEESGCLEYKASAYYNYRTAPVPEDVLFRQSVLKTVAGFLNAKGGRLVIGIDDDGNILGIQPDLELKEWDGDRYVNTMSQRIGSDLGMDAAAMTTITLEIFPQGTVCNVEVLPSPNPVFLKAPNNQFAFYVRVNNTTQELRGNDLANYVKRRWD